MPPRTPSLDRLNRLKHIAAKVKRNRSERSQNGSETAGAVSVRVEDGGAVRRRISVLWRPCDLVLWRSCDLPGCVAELDSVMWPPPDRRRPGGGHVRRPQATVAAMAVGLALGLVACSEDSGPPVLTWYINPDDGGQAEIAQRCT